MRRAFTHSEVPGSHISALSPVDSEQVGTLLHSWVISGTRSMYGWSASLRLRGYRILAAKSRFPFSGRPGFYKISEASANFSRPAIVAVHIVTNVRKWVNALTGPRLELVHFLVEGGSADFLRPKKQPLKQGDYTELLHCFFWQFFWTTKSSWSSAETCDFTLWTG